MRPALALAMVLALTLAVPALAVPASPANQRTLYPIIVAGITLYQTTDGAQVARFRSKGFATGRDFIDRYYVDPARRATLHYQTATDGIITRAELTAGVALPKTADPQRTLKAATNAVFEPDVEFGIRLADTPERVIARLGKPATDRTTGATRILTYSHADTWLPTKPQETPKLAPDSDPYVRNYEATYTFQKGRLTKLTIENTAS